MAFDLTSLESAWELNESSGNASDAHGSNTLTNNNSTAYAAGLLNNAADFEATTGNQYLGIDDNTSLSTGDIDFTITCWVKLESNTGANQFIVNKYKTTTADREYAIYCTALDGSGRFRFGVSSTGSDFTNEPADVLGEPSTGTWYFIVAWHDATANTINIQVNNGTVDSQAYSSGVFDSAARFQIGADDDENAEVDGLVDQVTFWKRTLTAAEKTTLYNSGAGVEYPFTVAAFTPKVVIIK